MSKMLRIIGSIVFISILLLNPVSAALADDILKDLSSYDGRDLGEARLNSIGSDSMAGLVDVWARTFLEYHPQLTLQVVSRGSASAPAALIDGIADLGPMSRPMKSFEIEKFQKRYGFQPTQIRSAISGAAIYVSKDNPIDRITFNDLDAIFSSERLRGEKFPAITWSDLGVSGDLGSKRIMAVAGTGTSYHALFFKQKVMKQANYSNSVKFLGEDDLIFDILQRNPAAIAVGPIMLEPENRQNVKMIAVSRTSDDVAFKPSPWTLSESRYPLGRFLNVYVVKNPDDSVARETKEFLRFILSREGQKIVLDQGLIPLSAPIAKAELKKLN